MAKNVPTKVPLPDKFQYARQEFARQYPYFNTVLWAIEWYLMDDINGMQTMAVDKYWRGYYTKSFVEALSSQEMVGLLYHEIRHLILNHHSRMSNMHHPKYADDEISNLHELRNIAADLEVNDRLQRDGVTLPRGALSGIYPSTIKFPSGLLAEEYFDLICKKKSPPPSGGCGSCAGGKPIEGEMDGSGKDAIHGEQTEQIIRRVADEIAKNPGNAPGSLRDWANATLKGTPIPWQTVLTSLVRRLVSIVAGQTDYTFSMRSRRDLPGVICPTLAGPQVNVAIVQDTSGSMGDWGGPLIQECLAQIPKIVKGAKGIVQFVSCDYDASEATRVKNTGKVELSGGGGTDMTRGIDKALTLKPRPQIIIVMTDGFTPWPLQPTPVPLVIAVPPGHADVNTMPSWAKVVKLYNE